ncbi:autotransporter outer membrane beta-barrel domain-containing protein [Candidatus Pelagibacter sp.]|nr:autotransporter outer membrane beta-barrel domain-containing protein [Candidatus Pelagibacter sp.]
MKFIKNFILILLFIVPVSNSFGAMHTFVQKAAVTDGTNNDPSGVHFNPAGTKMFILSQYPDNSADDVFSHVSEYNLSTPFDVSTKNYAGDGERCILNNGEGDRSSEHGPTNWMHDLKFSHNGMMLFVGRGNAGSANANGDRVFRFDLTSPYDISTCNFPVGSAVHATSNLDDDDLQDGSNAGTVTVPSTKNRLRGFDFSNDGKRLFVLFGGAGSNHYTRLLEYQLSIAYDLSTISIVTDAGIRLQDSGSADTPVGNAKGLDFSPDGKKLWVVDHAGAAYDKDITQISLDVAFSTSSYTIDGTVELPVTGDGNAGLQPSGLTFSTNGLKMYTLNDEDEDVLEYNLVCPFNIIEGKCPSITTGDRTGMAIAQIEVATRTIEHSTDTALNRLKWIRRNKDNQNLTNLNLDFNFTNQMLASLTKAVKTSAIKKNKQDKQQDVFYWSEGTIAVGRVGETNVSSFKKVKTDAVTFGADKFTNNGGIRGLAFRFGKNDIDVGAAGSNLDTDTYNLTHYTSSPIEDDTKFIDTIIGVGVLNSDILSVLDGERVTADRKGRQIYGTIKLKDEIKKNNLILIPSGQIDLGYTLLDAYQESGTSAMKYKKQSIQSRNARLSIAAVDELENNKYKIRKHGKLEYKANLNRSSNIKYSYVSDTTSGEFDTKLNSGALHNLNAEVGIDIILPDSFSIFLIYERNQALGVGHTDKIHLAIGYLPNKKTNYAFKLEGSENIGSVYMISKNINDFEIDFKLNNQDVLKPNIIDEATISLKKIF